MANWKELKNYLKDEDLFVAVKKAFEDLYTNDEYLICNKPSKTEDKEQLGSHHVGERAIVFRFALYLQNELLKSKKYALYNLDCEYNRNKSNPKTLPNFPNGVYPDLIIHKRDNNDDNLLVIEFKTYWNKAHTSVENDKKKVNQLMYDPYNYSYGLVVIVERTIDELQIIQITGKEVLD